MKTILEIIQEKKETIPASCNGRQTCGKCKIKVKENLPITPIEKNLLTSEEKQAGIRLACCHVYTDDIEYQIVHQDMDILDEMSVSHEKNCFEDGNGIIVDIGTTTVVMKWISLQDGQTIRTISFQNPQATYGGDVISRIDYSNQHPHILHQVLVKTLEENLIKNNDINVKRMVVCGNTVMTNLFLDSDISSLGHVPFTIPIQKTMKVHSHHIFDNQVQSFDIYTFPHISAFVGGDITAGLLALHMDQEEKTKMLIDLGTNGEIALGNQHRIITTSTAVGPAFEGVGMTCGGPSIPGAVTSVRIDHEKVILKTINHQKPQSICGSGLISLVAELKRHDVIDEMGRFKEDIDAFYLTDTIFITKKDIQTFQLAKAAIQAGVTTLLQESQEVDEIYISGGFGAHIRTDDLVELNIIPKQYAKRIKNMNNSAISGAYILLRENCFERLDHIIQCSFNINLAEYPYFDDLLIDGLYF